MRFTVILAILLWLLASVTSGFSDSAEMKCDTSLLMLRALSQTSPGRLEEKSRMTASGEGVEVSLRFTSGLSDKNLLQWKDNGVQFHNLPNGKIMRAGSRVYRARVSWKALEELIRDPAVEWIESVWGVPPVQPLDIANPAVLADQTWTLTDESGTTITGSGVLIGDMDWGCDIFHPDFFRADGALYDWIDVNTNGVFDKGFDAVDLDGNGLAGLTTETLSFFDGVFKDGALVENNDNVYQSDLDWLYNDTNKNGTRDFGVAAGFTESDPTYGERMFLLADENGNKALDPGEKLRALNTSKFKYYRRSNGTVFERGINMINVSSYPVERQTHGTGVSGILCAQEPGYGRRYVGIAPDADIAFANISPDFDYVANMAWMESVGADVILHEYSEIVGFHMDGSSNTEIAIKEQTLDKNITHIIPTGNLGRAHKHGACDIPGSDTLSTIFNVRPSATVPNVYLELIWLDQTNLLSVDITDPLLNIAHLGAVPSGTNTDIPGVTISDYASVSPRGSILRQITFSKTGGLTRGDWTVTFTNEKTTTESLRMRVYDNLGWSPGGAEFTSHQTRFGNATSPVWADEGIGVGSYATRGNRSQDPSVEGGAGAPPGDLSGFSGRGNRFFDGRNVVDIAAPGNYDIRTACNQGGIYPFGSYFYMSGTSGASPFATAACALLKQAKPGITPHEMEQYIRDNAITDAFTGAVPDQDEWGAGKINIYGAALAALATPTPTATPTPLPPTPTPTPTPLPPTPTPEPTPTATPSSVNGWQMIGR